MSLLQSWKESLLFLKPENIKLLLLVTVRTLYQSYKFFILLFLLFVLFESNLWQFLLGVSAPFFGIIQKILLVNLFFLFVLVARPSVKRKSAAYFLDYNCHFMIWALISFLVILLRRGQDFAWLYKASGFAILPIGFFWILFWLDARCTIENLLLSLLQAIKMFVFNFPFCLLFFMIPFFVFSLIKLLVSGALFKYLEIFIFILYICFFTNFYVKRLHDQFHLYFR